MFKKGDKLLYTACDAGMFRLDGNVCVYVEPAENGLHLVQFDERSYPLPAFTEELQPYVAEKQPFKLVRVGVDEDGDVTVTFCNKLQATFYKAKQGRMPIWRWL